MFIIFNKDGSIFSQTQSDFVMQGSNRVNKVFVGFVDNEYSNWSCSGAFNLPNGTRFTIPGVQAQEGFEYLGVKYYGWVIELTNDVTMYSGNVALTVMVVSQNTNVLFTYLANITINETGFPLDGFWDNSITVAQFNDYMAQLAVKLQANTISAIVNENDLPEIGEKNVLYFIIGETSDTPYQVKMWNGSEYTLLGTINLSSFASKEDQLQFEAEINAQVEQIRGEVTNPFEVVATTSQLPSTNTGKIYIVAANNHWYYWNGTQYTDGGAFIESGLTVENLIDLQLEDLDQILYTYIYNRFQLGDKRPFYMEISNVANWIGNAEQVEPTGNAFGWYDATSGNIIVITNGGVSAIDNTYETRPIVNYNSLAERVIYDDEYTRLEADNVQEAIEKLVDKNGHLESQINEKLDKNGYSALAHVGLADNIASPDGITQDTNISFSPTGGTASIADGFAEIKEIKGLTLNVNQLVRQSSGNIDLIEGHVYYYKDSQSIEEIITATSTFTYITIVDPGIERLVDLTKMFGAGKEPPTVVEFNNLTRNIDTDTYNEGTLVSSRPNTLISTLFNAFDGEWNLGTISNQTGLPTSDTKGIHTNFINVVSGETYTFYNENEFANFRYKYVFEYDKNGNFLKANNTSQSGIMTVTLSNNTTKVRLYVLSYNDFVLPINVNVCFHLTHSGYRNGQFEPYVKNIFKLPEGVLNEPLRSARDAYDSWLKGQVIKRINEYTFTGNETFVDFAGTGKSLTIQLEGAKSVASNNEVGNIKWALGGETFVNNVNNDQPEFTIAINTTGRLYIATTKTSSELASALEGKSICYELAEPIITEYTDEESWNIPVSDFGTLQAVSLGSNLQIGRYVIFYMNNLRDKLRNLPDIPKCEDTTGTFVLKCINGTYIWVEE